MHFSNTAMKPYWWDAVALDRGRSGVEIPRETDVLIIGSGYTGASAALTLVQTGAKVIVVDALRIGEGASTRNGGQVLAGVKRPRDELAGDLGNVLADKIVAETEAAFDFFEERLNTIGNTAHYVRSGAFIGAHTRSVFETMKRRAPGLREATVVARSQVESEVGTSTFFGGMIRARGGQVHPGLYHQALVDAGLRNDVQYFEYSRVVAVRRAADGFETEIETIAPQTGKSEVRLVRSKEVLQATNGYTPQSMKWFASRVVPVSSHIIATEPLDPVLAKKLIPRMRAISDTRRMLSYFRMSPDGQRLIFGGRASLLEIDALSGGKRLHRMMCSFFPELRGVRISHSWFGKVAFAEDQLPHFGVSPDGVYYSGPCNGRGVALGTYLGHRTALRMLGQSQPGNSLDYLNHRVIHPGYSGNPWFLPVVGLWYRLQDTADIWRSAVSDRLKNRTD
ncbi:NAD(P)/FAD-dependent oxidoreductase [Hyphomicrobium facile]|uniref:Glycine/D-amino acid oxidase n=1 Tax=Hyphomicrobium facile TaxID=51670 RepID=A0A1I7NVI6_9HYPH|nr:FAD-binding oxidoreductase [Hyphomicrobium facile]SFV38679.1 Glycine/D-amino acid oxidase [Hyphomicrobium facile]